MHETEFLQNLSDENFLGGVNVHALGIVRFADDGFALFAEEIISFVSRINWLPNLGEIIVQSGPKLSCYHVIVRSQQKVILA